MFGNLSTLHIMNMIRMIKGRKVQSKFKCYTYDKMKFQGTTFPTLLIITYIKKYNRILGIIAVYQTAYDML